VWKESNLNRSDLAISEIDEVDGGRSPSRSGEFVLDILRNHYLLISACAIAGALFGIAELSITNSAYTASATLMIDARRGGVQQKSVLGDAEPSDAAWVDSQIGVLGLEREKIGRALAQKFASESEKDPSIFGGPTRSLQNFSSIVRHITGLSLTNDSDLPRSDEERSERLAGIIANGIEIKRVGLSYLVNINFSSNSQRLSSKIANAVADAYIAGEIRAKEQDLKQAADWLQERYQTLRDQANAADRAVIEFKNQHNIITSDGKLVTDQQLTALNTELSSARAKTADLQARVEEIEKILVNQEQTGSIEATVSDAIANPIISKLQGEYLELTNRQADWAKRFGPNHLAVVAIRNQIADIRKSIHDELRRIAEGYKSDLEIAQKSQAGLEKQLRSTFAQIPNDAEINLRSLQATAESYRTFYDNFFLRYTESIQQQSSPLPDLRVISYAPYAYQSYPSATRIMTIALLGGLGFGFSAGFLRQKMEKGFRTGSEVENRFNRECLAMVPLLRASDALSSRGRYGELTMSRDTDRQSYTFTDEQRIITHATSSALELVNAPFSRFAETIRALKMSADVREKNQDSLIIGLTSALPQEGKSTISTAFASLAGLTGARVILVDCDLRNPALSLSLTPTAQVGLLDIISGEQSIESVVWRDPLTGMDFLPAANTAGLANTAQLLSTNAVRGLFQDLRRRYEYIIVDLSPLLPVVDVRATTDFVDFYLFTIEWARTPFEMVRAALSSSREVYRKIGGFVLNKVSQKAIGDHYYYRPLLGAKQSVLLRPSVAERERRQRI
jgi:polysaccharide biosynthesis transport protein